MALSIAAVLGLAGCLDVGGGESDGSIAGPAVITVGDQVVAVAQALEDRLHVCGDRRTDIAEDFIGSVCGPGGLDCTAPAIEFDIDACESAMVDWECDQPGIPSECYDPWLHGSS
jgi:hypothetical protein